MTRQPDDIPKKVQEALEVEAEKRGLFSSPNAIPLDTLKPDDFIAHRFPDCRWCVMSPWIITQDGVRYRHHCADNMSRDDAQHLAMELQRVSPNANPSHASSGVGEGEG